MKTWFNFIPVIILAVVFPIAAGLLGTVERNGKYFGGGPVREYTINQMAKLLPADKANKMIDRFMEGSYKDEVLLYLPIAINLSLICLLMVYCIGSITIFVNNFIVTAVFHTKRDAAKK